MAIRVGERIPESKLGQMGEKGPENVSTTDYFRGRRVVLFAVPGAFTPTCSARHLPGYIELKDDIMAKGVDALACMAVNDVFVMHAWGRHAGAEGIDMLADGNADFSAALGLDLDARDWGMGIRSQRFALVVNDGVVEQVFVEAPGEFRVSSAEYVLGKL
jgi:peroxiredoxin